MATYSLSSHLSTLESDPIRNFKFLVDFKHQTRSVSAGAGKTDVTGAAVAFTSVDGLNVTTAAMPYRSGGMNTAPQQIPGQSSFSPITFSRGVILGSRQNWDWMRELFNVTVGDGTGRRQGDPNNNFRGDVYIHILEHPITSGTDHIAPMEIRVYNAWPTAVSYSPLNAGDNGFMVESLTLAHEGFSVNWAPNLSTQSQTPGL